MNNDWMTDARKVPDDVMTYIRRIAVHAVLTSVITLKLSRACSILAVAISIAGSIGIDAMARRWCINNARRAMKIKRIIH
jgi:hypothetical protein